MGNLPAEILFTGPNSERPHTRNETESGRMIRESRVEILHQILTACPDPSNALAFANACVEEERLEDALMCYSEVIAAAYNVNIPLPLAKIIECCKMAAESSKNIRSLAIEVGVQIYERADVPEIATLLGQLCWLNAQSSLDVSGVDLEETDVKQKEVDYWLDQALMFDPECISTKLNIAQTAFREGHLEDAIALYEDLLKVEPKNVEVLRALAEIKFKQNNYPVAYAYLDQIERLSPTFPSYVYSLMGVKSHADVTAILGLNPDEDGSFIITDDRAAWGSLNLPPIKDEVPFTFEKWDYRTRSFFTFS